MVLKNFYIYKETALKNVFTTIDIGFESLFTKEVNAMLSKIDFVQRYQKKHQE